MTETLAGAYQAALAMMQVTGPGDLHAAASFVARETGERLDDCALRDYVSQVGPNDPLQMDLRLRLAGWDHMGPDVAWADGTAPEYGGPACCDHAAASRRRWHRSAC